LFIVELKAIALVLKRAQKYPDFHQKSCFSAFLTTSQSMLCSGPFSNALSRSSRTTRCHSGEGSVLLGVHAGGIGTVEPEQRAQLGEKQLLVGTLAAVGMLPARDEMLDAVFVRLVHAAIIGSGI
jgi:hypothetical protein